MEATSPSALLMEGHLGKCPCPSKPDSCQVENKVEGPMSHLPSALTRWGLCVSSRLVMKDSAALDEGNVG